MGVSATAGSSSSVNAMVACNPAGLTIASTSGFAATRSLSAMLAEKGSSVLDAHKQMGDAAGGRQVRRGGRRSRSGA